MRLSTYRSTCVRAALACAGLVVLASGCGSNGPHVPDAGGDASGDAIGSPSDAVASDSSSDAASSDAQSEAVFAGPSDAAADVADVASDARTEPSAAGDASDARTEADAAGDASDAPKRVPYLATAISVGRYDGCAILDDGKMKCWGSNSYGELGLGDSRTRGNLPSEMGDALPTVDLGTGRTALQIAVGRYITCALLDNHTVKCWGLGLDMVSNAPENFIGDGPGEMGDALPVMDLGPGRTAKRVAAGNFAACVQRDDETLRCWATGMVGTFDVPLPAGRKIVAMTGAVHIGLLLDDGSVWSAYPSDLPAVSLQPLALGAGRKARAIGGSLNKLGAALEGGGVVGNDTAMSSFAQADLFALAFNEMTGPCGLRADHGVTCWRSGADAAWSDALVKANPDDPVGTVNVKLGGPAIDLQGGGWSHTCALLADHTVRCWSSEGDSGTLPELGASFATGGADAGAPPRWLPVDLGTHPAP